MSDSIKPPQFVDILKEEIVNPSYSRDCCDKFFFAWIWLLKNTGVRKVASQKEKAIHLNFKAPTYKGELFNFLKFASLKV